MKKDDKTKELVGHDADFQRRLKEDPAAALAEVGIQLLEDEVAHMRKSLKSVLERSLGTEGSTTHEHKVTKELGDKKLMILLSVIHIQDSQK